MKDSDSEQFPIGMVADVYVAVLRIALFSGFFLPAKI